MLRAISGADSAWTRLQMSYGVEVGPEAVEDLARFPISVQRAVLIALRQLAIAPTRLARPARPPYPTGMLYREYA